MICISKIFSPIVSQMISPIIENVQCACVPIVYIICIIQLYRGLIDTCLPL